MKRYRKLRGLSQEDLARLAGVTLPAVQAAEQGKNTPKFATAKAYDDALDAGGGVLGGFGYRAPVTRTASLDARVENLETQVEGLAEILEVVIRATTRDALSERMSIEQLLEALQQLRAHASHS